MEGDQSFWFGALVIVGRDFPAIEDAPRNLRIRLPGNTKIPYGMIHDAVVQGIIQRCLFAERSFAKSKTVDEYGLPELTIAQLQRLADLINRPATTHPKANHKPKG